MSDTHLTVPEFESDSLFPKQLEKLTPIRRRVLYTFIRQEIERAFTTTIEWLRQNGPWDLIVHLGDITGGYGEGGSHHPSVQAILVRCRDELLTLGREVRWCFGNHDTGYGQTSMNVGGSGLAPESLLTLEVVLGSSWWSHEVEGVLLLGLAAPLATYNGPYASVELSRRLQREFVWDTLRTWKGPFVLFAHTIRTVHALAPVLGPHKDRCLAFIYGDIHDPRKAILARLIAPLIRLGGTSKARSLGSLLGRSHCVPSTAPLWWRGYGLLELTIEDGRVKTREIKLSRPRDSVEIPTASFWRCAWWLLCPRSM